MTQIIWVTQNEKQVPFEAYAVARNSHESVFLNSEPRLARNLELKDGFVINNFTPKLLKQELINLRSRCLSTQLSEYSELIEAIDKLIPSAPDEPIGNSDWGINTDLPSWGLDNG